MKAITQHEPFATLVAFNFKEVETRGWYTDYRGPLAIHAAIRQPDPTDLSRVTFSLGAKGFQLPTLTFGAVLCTCELVACLPAAGAAIRAKILKPPFEPRRGWAFEQQFGNYTAGRWAWILRNVERFPRPIAAKGFQKLWEWQQP